jgi:hypothetical protein
MKLGELKEIIKNIPSERDGDEVVLQKDAEGNGYSPLYGVDVDSLYIPDSTWDGVAYHKDWTADEACMDEEEWNETKSQKQFNAIIFWPTN